MTKRIVIDGFLAALSLIAFMLESLIPAILLPGAKLGFANIFIFVALVLFGLFDGLAIMIIKSILGSLFFGAFSQIIYSLSAGITALMVAYIFIVLFKSKLSIVSISALSGAIHNVVQIILFSILNNSMPMLAYIPYLGMVGMLSGVIVGFVVLLVLNNLPKKLLQGAMN